MEKLTDTIQPLGADKIKLNVNHAIEFAPKPRLQRKYGITIKYYNEGSEDVAKRIDYQIHLLVNQFRDENKTWQLCFNKSDLFIDRHEPDFVSEQLASMAMAAIYPVKVDVNSVNEVFRGIVNHSEILKRWEQVAEKIGDKYEGRYAELFLSKMENKIADRYELQNALRVDMFWNIFFHPQYLKYQPDLSQQISFSFPVIAYKNVAFEGIQSVAPYYTDYGTFKVNFHSESDTTAEQVTLLNQEGAFKMKLNAICDLDRDGGLLKHARVDWKLYKKKDPNEIGVKRIQFTAYEIESSVQAANPGLHKNEGSDPVPVEKKKGFWTRVLG